METISEIYYYERCQGEYLLWIDGVPVACRSFSEMASFAENPELAEFTEVSEHNWEALYEQGAFHA